MIHKGTHIHSVFGSSLPGQKRIPAVPDSGAFSKARARWANLLAVAAVTIAFGSVASGQCSHSFTDSFGNPVFAMEVQYQGAVNVSVNVTTTAGCTWTAVSNAPTWITITSGSTGTGSGIINFSVQQNTAGSRIGSLVVGGQATLTITQVKLLGPSAVVTQVVMSKNSGVQGITCSPATAPPLTLTFASTDAEAYLFATFSNLNRGDTVTEQYYAPNGSLYSSAGGSFTSTESGGIQCIWDTTATGLKISGAPPAGMPGAWTVELYVNQILIIHVPFTITGTNTCAYTLSGSTNTLGDSGGTGSINVTTNPGCPWSSATTLPWIHITSGLSGTGSGTVGYSVDVNAGGARSGTISIAGQTFTISQAANGPAAPSITQGGIADPWTNSPGLAPGAWVTIYGANLASAALSWAPIAGQPLPTSLGGVTVTIDGQPAVPNYVSPTQVDVLVPAAVRLGPIQIVVNNNGNAGNPYPAMSTSFLPAIYANAAAGSSPTRFYVTAVDPVTEQYVGNFSVDPRVVHAARAGETIDLYALGLGPASPFPTGTAFTGAYSLSSSVTVTLGGTPLTPLFAALVAPGLYQVRITIPANVSVGDQLIQLNVAGQAQSPQNVYLSIGQ
jgi:uncharacterized protein (TIGR03437 family)